jgi:hypothetical protein
MPDYHVAYDIAQAGYNGWSSLGILFAFVLVGLVKVFFPQIWDSTPARWPLARPRKVFRYGFLYLALAILILSFAITLGQYEFVKQQYLNGDASAVAGRVTKFIPGTNIRGSAYEDFCVQEKCFEYSDDNDKPGFHTMAINGGPIQEGTQVRVTYVGDSIVKLEVADSAPPTFKSLQEYDAYLKSTCNADDKRSFATCSYALILNGEMATGATRMFAEQELQAIYTQQAKDMLDTDLSNQIDLALRPPADMDTEQSLKIAAYINELNLRNYHDPIVDGLIDTVVQKYGPCWGIPEGQCRE